MLLRNSTGNSAYLNMLIDWDHDGSWATPPYTCSDGGIVSEHPLVNLAVPSHFIGRLSQLNPPRVTRVGWIGYAWARFTISDVPAPDGWTGGGAMGHGETEDYLFRVEPDSTTAVAGVSDEGREIVFEPAPNPARGEASLQYRLSAGARVGLAVFDAAGRQVRDLGTREESRGMHRMTWDGRTDSGRSAPTGAYFLRLTIGAGIHTRRVLLVH